MSQIPTCEELVEMNLNALTLQAKGYEDKNGDNLHTLYNFLNQFSFCKLS